MACSEKDYQYLREIVLAQSANVIDASRDALFESRLTPLARTSGATDVEGLVQLLRAERPAQLQRAVAEAMTVNETSFFRDGKPFQALRDEVIPKLIEARSKTRRLRIWSAAASTGQEAYSLAMLLLEDFPELAGWDVKIVGTDISREVVDHAQRGRYRRLDVNRGLPARLLLKYFERDGEEWAVRPRVRELCEFERANLLSPPPALPMFDLVLLRNVLLYFPKTERGAVLDQVHRRMAADGFLVLGNAEQAEDSSRLFEAEFAGEVYFYRRVN